MNERELLELAAKSAGLAGAKYDNWPGMDVRYGFDSAIYHPDVGYWNPLTDDGDALRLAVKLGISIGIKTIPHAVYVEASNGHAPAAMETLDDVRGKDFDHYAATRRAIVRAAAEIGKAR